MKKLQKELNQLKVKLTETVRHIKDYYEVDVENMDYDSVESLAWDLAKVKDLIDLIDETDYTLRLRTEGRENVQTNACAK